MDAQKEFLEGKLKNDHKKEHSLSSESRQGESIEKAAEVFLTNHHLYPSSKQEANAIARAL